MTSDEELFEHWRTESLLDADRIDIAIRIYDEVLVPEGGAFKAKGRDDNTLRQQFVQWFASGSPGREFRFEGRFGFGGKFWDSKTWHVNYYSEDRDRERDKVEERTNKLLTLIQEEVEGGAAI